MSRTASHLVFLCVLVISPATAAQVSQEAPYDLASDRESRIELAKAELGPRVRVRVIEDVFVMVGASDGGSLVERALSAFFNRRFDKRPERAVSVYVFDGARPYEAYCRKRLGGPCISSYGFYRPDLRRIVMNAGPGLGTLTHELVHPIVESDFPNAPTWLDEGIASLFEAPVMPSAGEIHGRTNWRHPRLTRALGRGDERTLVSIERLFLLSDAEFRGAHEDLNYALARYFCQWLDSRGQLWPFYRGFRDGFAGDRSGVAALTQATGLQPAAATAQFVSWLRRLK